MSYLPKFLHTLIPELLYWKCFVRTTARSDRSTVFLAVRRIVSNGAKFMLGLISPRSESHCVVGSNGFSFFGKDNDSYTGALDRFYNAFFKENQPAPKLPQASTAQLPSGNTSGLNTDEKPLTWGQWMKKHSVKTTAIAAGVGLACYGLYRYATQPPGNNGGNGPGGQNNQNNSNNPVNPPRQNGNPVPPPTRPQRNAQAAPEHKRPELKIPDQKAREQKVPEQKTAAQNASQAPQPVFERPDFLPADDKRQALRERIFRTSRMAKSISCLSAEDFLQRTKQGGKSHSLNQKHRAGKPTENLRLTS